VLTVAVSVSSGVQNAAAAIPGLSGHEATVACALVIGLAAMNLRGVRESGAFFAIPTYGFMLGILGMTVYAAIRAAQGTLPDVESADLVIHPAPGYGGDITQVAMIFLLARAFSSGCAALTGVEAISNGVPAFRKPKSKNAASTLFLLGALAVTMLMSIVVLARNMGLKYVDPNDLDRLTEADGSELPEGYDQHTVVAQLAKAVFSDFPPGFYFVLAMTGIILILAANTAFNGFPVLGSILARDGFAPRQLGSRGDRLAYSNGILFLAGLAMVLILAFNAETTRLIQLYIVGVFVSFNLSQLGMIRHWTRLLKTEDDSSSRRRMFRSRLINTFGLGMTAVVFVVVLLTKFLAGAWIAILAMVVFYAILRAIRRHYDRVELELTVEDTDPVLPTRVHAIVLVSKLHKPTMRALAYAKASRPNLLEAVFVDVDGSSSNRLVDEWDAQRIDVPLKLLYSPYREIIRPIVDYAIEIREANPRGVVAVYIPEYVVGRWWEQLLHNQTALRLKGRLLFTPGVMVTSVPYQLRSSEIARERELRDEYRVRPGDLRRGDVDRRGDHPDVHR
jgi:amino acid transporter